MLADLPALLAINMKMIQSIAGSYGYSLTSPTEQILSLQVLNAASLSKKLHADVMHWLEENHLDEAEAFLSHRQGTIIQPEWLETLAKQWIKSLVLYGMKKTTKHSFSILGIALGANLNYQFTKNVAQFSSQFYRQRYLKSNGRDEFGEYERA
ncbi:EcsC family protein [Caldalkalibacillus mannanilyticus]|uniref:EcsC family protein n=1 Tax=Caldalkalibacillus mannanilyticus TaxID=1418 RepID=UPI002714F8E6|nr:EcsC family protein [Caldalkalibacillus mannanilyticus]